MAATTWSFWTFEIDGSSLFSNSLQQIASRQAATETGEPSKLKLIGRALKNRTTLIGALFIFAYQGAEVSESGWVITYLIVGSLLLHPVSRMLTSPPIQDYRRANPAHVGYVTSGFWGGITLGRFVLTHFARKFGEKIFVFALCIGVIVFQLLCWFLPSVIGDAGKSKPVWSYSLPITDNNRSRCVDR